MWISNVGIRNFRPFCGGDDYLEIDLPPKSARAITVVKAKSDVGKTTFLSAIAWCLYGRETSENKDKELPPFSTSRLYAMGEKDIDSMEVSLTLNDDESNLPIYTIKRSQNFQKYTGDDSANQLISLGESSLEVAEWDEKNNFLVIPDSSAQRVVNEILPEEIHLFFLFEGEKLERHFSFIEPETVRGAIERTSQIEQVHRAIRHLNSVKDSVWDEDDPQPEMKALREEIDGLQGLNDQNERKRQEQEKEISGMNSEISDIDSFLGKHDEEAIQQLSLEAQSIEKDFQREREKLRGLKTSWSKEVLYAAPPALGAKSLSELHQALINERAKDALQPNIDSRSLMDLLEHNRCVCGRSLDPNNKADEKHIALIKKKLEANKLDEASELIREGVFKIQSAWEKALGSFETIEEFHEQVKEKKKYLREKESLLQEKQERLVSLGDNVVETKQRRKNELEMARRRLEESNARLKLAMQNRGVEIAQKRRDLERKGRKLKGYELSKKKAAFLDSSLEALENIRDSILSEVRQKVQQETWKSFSNIHWLKDKYTDFIITSDYELRLCDSQGSNWIANLAGGPKQIFLLSFIAALNKVSGFRFPVLIDTPMANLDQQQRLNVASLLPMYLKDSQVIILVKDQEYGEEIRKLILPRLSEEYEFRINDGCTKVIRC